MPLEIKGYASYYNLKDFQNDVIKPNAFDDDIKLIQSKNKKIRLLMHHNQHIPIANIEKIMTNATGLWIEAIIDENIIDILPIEKNLIGDLSIGIIPVDYHYEKNIRIIKKAILLEISLVTIGANPWSKVIEINKH